MSDGEGPSGGEDGNEPANDDGGDASRVDPENGRPGWPVDLTGVTETVVTTMGPNGRWNAAALGLFAPDETSDAVTATTWGNTRTRRNFHREGGGYVQFVSDPVVFVDAALSIVERDEPVLDAADAWVRVSVELIDDGTERDTRWERWALEPETAGVCEERVPTINRGLLAVVEASVLASRLGVAGYDEDRLRRRLDYCTSIVDRTGGLRERTALERIREHAGVDLELGSNPDD